MRGTSLRVQHLLCVPVVCGNEKNVACLLASLVDGLDGLVRGANGLYCGIVYAGVTNLFI